ncbi:MAG TPA: hypothetical protein VFA07_12135 [Chthonomonadaceae bacterium]|nr:hypothetical protein [Chthonomonadaceae bacterium]
MKLIYRWILSLSLIASCAGVVGLSPVKAQDRDDNYQNKRQDLRQDRRQLQNLRNQRKGEIREHDRNGARYYNGQISQLHRDMRQDTRYHRRWNNRNQNRDWDDYRDRDDQRQWNGSQRWHRQKKHHQNRDRDHDRD